MRWAVHITGILAALALSAMWGCDEPETTTIETHFCKTAPETCSEALLSLIHGASSWLECAVFTFTLTEVADALVEAAERGVDVWVVYESKQENASVVSTLQAGGVFVRADGNADLMHHKFMVADGSAVLTGSFNWTLSADNGHDENMVIIHSSEVAEIYHQEFERVWGEAL